jgi:hypothetical protein
MVAPKQKPKMSLVIDIQAKLQAGKGYGYMNWAKGFNLYQASKSLIYLQEHGITDYALLEKSISDSRSLYHNLSGKIKADEKRMDEIKTLQKHIGTYRKTREIYRQYRALPPKKRNDFYEAHHSDIDMHRAAKKHFDEAGYGKDNKLPSMDTLKQEYAILAAGMGKQYAEYKQERGKMIALQMVKQNIDYVLDGQVYPAKTHVRDRS